MHDHKATTYHYPYDDLPAALPVFPLGGVLLLPHGTLPLNIFEPRYLQMFDDVLKNNRLIGIIQPKNDKGLEKTGCVGRITDFHHTQDGRYMVSLYGLYRFDVEEELSTTTPYRKIKPSWHGYKDDAVCNSEYRFQDRKRFETVMLQYFKSKDMECDIGKIETTPCTNLITALSMICPFSAQEKQMLLTAATLDERGDILMKLFEMESYDQSSHLKH